MRRKSSLRFFPGALALAIVTLISGPARAATLTWNLNLAGPSAWNANASWTPNTGFPNAIDDVANLTKDISANNAISMGAPVTVGTLKIGDLSGNNFYTINSGSALTFDVSSGSASLIRTAAGTGADAINTAITLNDPLIARVDSNTLLVGGAIDGSGQTVTKTGAGTLSLTGANTYSGATTVSLGILNLGGGTASGSLSSSTELKLGGGTFTYTRTGTNSQTFASTTILGSGASVLNTMVATNTIDLGTLSRNTGGTVDFGSIGTIGTSTANTNGILSGWATFNGGANWAINNGSNVITGGATYYTTTTGGNTATNYDNQNIDASVNATFDAAINANSLRFNAAAIRTLTLNASGTSILQSGGILVTTSVGNNLSTISGGTLTGSAGGDLIVHQYNASNGLTINSVIANNGGTTGLTKTGSGVLSLTGANTFTGPITVGGGNLVVNNLSNGGIASTLGQSSNAAANLILGNGSTFTYNGNTTVSTDRLFTLNGSATLSGNGSGATNPFNLTNTGAIAFGTPNQALTLTLGGTNTTATNVLSAQITDNGNGAVSLVKTSTGTVWRLTNPNNSFTGGVRFNRGFLEFSSGALGTTGTIGFDANSLPPFGLRWAPGNTDDISARFNGVTSANGGIGTLDVGSNDVIFANGISPGKNPSWIIKEGSGSLTMNGVNVWGSALNGATTINAGTLVAKFLSNGGTNDSIGGVQSAAQWFGLRNGATLKYVGTGSTNDHNFHLSGDTAIDASGTGPLVFSQTGAISPTPASRSFGIILNSKTTGNAPSTSSDLVPGMMIGGTGIAAGSKIVSIGINSQVTFDLNATQTTTTTISFGSYAAGTLTLTGTNTSDNEIKGTLQDSVSNIDASLAVRSLAKTNVGKWILNGVNTYTGATTISGGTLSLGTTGSIANSASVSIAAGATLDTSGQATYAIPSGKPVTFRIDATGPGSGGRITAAALDISNATVSYSIVGIPDDPAYVLATYTSLSGTPNFASVDPAPSGYTLNYAYEGNKIALVQTGGGNTPPIISDITDQSIPSGGTTGPLNVNVSDTETAVGALVVSGASSNPTLVPNGNIATGGSGATRTVTVTPVPGLVGTATITVTVTDGGSLTSNDTFVLTVTNNYLSWATANSVTGGATGDSDNDGVKNLVEYALVNGGERGVLSGNTITFTKRGAPYGGDVAYGIETSTDLLDWITPGSGVTQNPTSISYTFTPSTPVKNFARLKVTSAP